MRGYTITVKEFVEYSGFETPDEMISELVPGEVLRKLDEYIGWCNSKGNAPGTQIRKFAQLKRWLQSNDVELDWKKVVLPKQRRIVRDKAPTRAELRKILMYTRARFERQGISQLEVL